MALVKAPQAIVLRRRPVRDTAGSRFGGARRRRGDHLGHRINRKIGLWLVKEEGTWSAVEDLTETRRAAAEMVIGGGHEDYVDEVEAARIRLDLGAAVTG